MRLRKSATRGNAEKTPAMTVVGVKMCFGGGWWPMATAVARERAWCDPPTAWTMRTPGPRLMGREGTREGRDRNASGEATRCLDEVFAFALWATAVCEATACDIARAQVPPWS